MTVGALRSTAVVALLLALVACRSTGDRSGSNGARPCVPMTGGSVCVDDRGDLSTCTSCWPRAPSPARFTCAGDGPARRCKDTRPRQPDDGDWECSETTGVTVCRGGLAPAGVSRGAPDPGWVCGAHAVGGGDAGAYPRVCVDFAPDYPAAEGWTCRYAYGSDTGGARTCEPSLATRVGDACAGSACPAGTRCASGRCLPPVPAPTCFFDQDCSPPAKCTFGTCRAG